MNWNRLQPVCRISVEIGLVITLILVSFFQLMKYREENTNVSLLKDDNLYLELPSLTFCPVYEGKNEEQGNLTFEEYMEGVLNASDFFDWIVQIVYLPGKGYVY